MTTVTEPTTTDCPNWCKYDWPSEPHTHISEVTTEIKLELPPPVRVRYPHGYEFVPVSVAACLVQDGTDQPHVTLDRNEKTIASLTLDETAALAVWLLELHGAARPTPPLKPAPAVEEIMAQLRELDKEAGGTV